MSVVQQSASIAAWRERQAQLAAVAAVKPAPVVLVPTLAQRRAGVLLVDARDDQMPDAACKLRDAVAASGGAVRATYAHALVPPATAKQGEDWQDRFSVAVRVQRGQARGWAVWVNGAFDSAQWRERPGEFPRGVGAKEFSALAAGQAWEPPVVAPPVPCPEPGCGKLVRVKQDGGLYAHKCGEQAAAPGKVKALTH